MRVKRVTIRPGRVRLLFHLIFSFFLFFSLSLFSRSQTRASVKELAIAQSGDIEPRFQQPVLVALLTDGSMLAYKITARQTPERPQAAQASESKAEAR